jgi:SAM-dependent methyltransferase
MDENTGHGKTYFQGAEVREGRILASNTDRQVEDSYETAYNLGCGKRNGDGWINVDLHSDIADIQCDLRKLELATDSADAVAAIHVLEHFYEWEVYDLLTEWKRVLKPGGKMILELPCMDKVFAYVHNCVNTKEPLQPFMTTFALWVIPNTKPRQCATVGVVSAPIARYAGNRGNARHYVLRASLPFSIS